MNISKIVFRFTGALALLILSSCGRQGHKSQAIKRLSWAQREAQAPVYVAPAPKKRVLIFSSTGGGGHTAAAQAIKCYLGDARYETEIVNVFSDVIQSIDLIHYYTGAYTGEHVYDYLLQNQFIFLAETYVALGRARLRSIAVDIESLLEEFLQHNRPDVIVSIIPIIDGAMYRVAKKLQIPFVIIPVDLDVRNYCNDLHVTGYEKFRFCLNFEEDYIKKNIASLQLPEEVIRYVGFPVRQDFLHERHTVAELKKEFNFPEDKKIIMVLMGSAGSRATYRYARAIAKMKLATPVHLILCLGRNESLRAAVEAIQFPPHVSVSIMGFTNRIADLMRVSDVLITKSGPTSVCEAVAVGVPMIIDHTQKILWWEKMNIQFVAQHGFGDELRMLRKLPKMLKRYLEDTNYTDVLRQRMQDFPSPPVEEKVCAVIDEALAMNDE